MLSGRELGESGTEAEQDPFRTLDYSRCFSISGLKNERETSRVWIKAPELSLLKCRATISCLHPTAEGTSAIYIPVLDQWDVWICPKLATSGQLEQSRDGNPRLGPAGNSACVLQRRGKRRARSGFWFRAGRFRCLSCLPLGAAVRYHLL